VGIQFSLVIQLVWYVGAMSSRKSEPWRFSTRDRWSLGVVGLIIFSLGVGALARGQIEYLNYWGGAVFAPFAILIGVGLVVVAAIQGRRS
jgi:hypothetical protein